MWVYHNSFSYCFTNCTFTNCTLFCFQVSFFINTTVKIIFKRTPLLASPFFPYRTFLALLGLFLKLLVHIFKWPFCELIPTSLRWIHRNVPFACLHGRKTALCFVLGNLAGKGRADNYFNFHFWKSSDSKLFLTFLLAIVLT